MVSKSPMKTKTKGLKKIKKRDSLEGATIEDNADNSLQMVSKSPMKTKTKGLKKIKKRDSLEGATVEDDTNNSLQVESSAPLQANGDVEKKKKKKKKVQEETNSSVNQEEESSSPLQANGNVEKKKKKKKKVQGETNSSVNQVEDLKKKKKKKDSSEGATSEDSANNSFKARNTLRLLPQWNEEKKKKRELEGETKLGNPKVLKKTKKSFSIEGGNVEDTANNNFQDESSAPLEVNGNVEKKKKRELQEQTNFGNHRAGSAFTNTHSTEKPAKKRKFEDENCAPKENSLTFNSEKREASGDENKFDLVQNNSFNRENQRGRGFGGRGGEGGRGRGGEGGRGRGGRGGEGGRGRGRGGGGWGGGGGRGRGNFRGAGRRDSSGPPRDMDRYGANATPLTPRSEPATPAGGSEGNEEKKGSLLKPAYLEPGYVHEFQPSPGGGGFNRRGGGRFNGRGGGRFNGGRRFNGGGRGRGFRGRGSKSGGE